MAGRKLFVGSLPEDITDAQLRAEFGKYGSVEDIYVKPHCPPGKQWAFVTLSSPEAAQAAKDETDRILHFHGAEQACEVMMAKNQGMNGTDAGGRRNGGGGGHSGFSDGGLGAGGLTSFGYSAPPAAAGLNSGGGGGGPRKIFIGSMPCDVSETLLRAEFSKFGHVLDVHLNNKPVDENRNWAFLTFASGDQANAAKHACDRILRFPGGDQACEVNFARNQGLYGQEATDQTRSAAPHAAVAYTQAVPSGPKKIFVGSLPMDASQEMVQAEFSRYGQVVDVHINHKPCEPGRNWAFVTFATPDAASHAKDATDRILMLPGADRPCEVMLAKNQGQHGQDPLHGAPPAAAPVARPAGGPGSQPPPPAAPAPAGLTPWTMYKTAAGLPYYHNHSTGVTQWECPRDLQVPGQGAYGASPPAAHGRSPRYAAY